MFTWSLTEQRWATEDHRVIILNDDVHVLSHPGGRGMWGDRHRRRRRRLLNECCASGNMPDRGSNARMLGRGSCVPNRVYDG